MAARITKDVRAYFAKIGRKGGKAGKGTPNRIAANKRTARNRWRKKHPVPEKIVVDTVAT